MEESVGRITKLFDTEVGDPSQLSPLVLAYMGDSAGEVVIRTLTVCKGNRQVNKMHHDTTKYVKAIAQSRMIQALEDELTETEHAIYKRGRNATSHTAAKNASIEDYRKATGWEAVLGYLFLNGEDARMLELIKKGIQVIDEETVEKKYE